MNTGDSLPVNPVTTLACWIALAILVQRIAGLELVALGAATMVLALAEAAPRFMRLMVRARWLFLSLLLIYALATPGQPLGDAVPLSSMTAEGVAGGAQQALRLTALLASLALLLQWLSREQLLAGIYGLLRPLRLAGINPERFAVRLGLTLSYADALPPAKLGRQGWQALAGSHRVAPPPAAPVLLPHQGFGWRDALALAVMAGLGGLLLA